MLFQRIRNWLKPAAATSPPAMAGHHPQWTVPVLCYHSWTAEGDAYEGNDHIALAEDLRALGRRAYRVLPLTTLVALLRGERAPAEFAGQKLVGLSFDDGRDADYVDLHDEQGELLLPSMHSVLEAGRSAIEMADEGPMAVSFVIASAQARTQMDQACARGRNEWRDDWWAECARRGLIGIANHSWDHVHDSLPQVAQRENRKGSFLAIDNFADAEAQIARAQRYIDQRCQGLNLPIFGYPYGDVAPYLRDDYLPAEGERIGLKAAFGTGGSSVRPDTPVWDIPRFVCGWHWRTPAELAALLDAVEGGVR